MDIVWILILLFVLPVLAMLVWLALSSCLGDGLRSRLRGARRNGAGSYGPEYLRTMTFSGPAMSEQIELDDMYREQQYEDERDR